MVNILNKGVESSPAKPDPFQLSCQHQGSGSQSLYADNTVVCAFLITSEV